MSTVAIETDNDSEYADECVHGIGFDEECEWCELDDELEGQQQAEECSDMNTFHRY